MELLLPDMGLIFWTVFLPLIIILPIIALVSALTSKFRDSTSKLMWVLVILFAPLLGPVLYAVIGRKLRVSA